MKRLTRLTAALVLLASPTFAQQPAGDAARQEVVVQQAVRSYEQGIEKLAKDAQAARDVQDPDRPLRELRLEEAVSLALEVVSRSITVNAVSSMDGLPTK